jgi:hypothetical protein
MSEPAPPARATAAGGKGMDAGRGKICQNITKKIIKIFDKNETMLYNISRSHISKGRRIKRVCPRSCRRKTGEGASDVVTKLGGITS